MIDYGLMAEKVFDLTYFNGRIAVILGSGLGKFSNHLKNQITISYDDIPGYPSSTVEGHKGELVCGRLDNNEILIANGRFHYYEGYSFQPELIDLAFSAAKEIDIELKSGNYCWTLGPSYETPAEIKDMINLGGDAVGMSTVPEIISAAELDIKVLTISCLTNFAAGITKKPLTHEDVVKTADKSSKEFSELLIKLLYKLKI